MSTLAKYKIEIFHIINTVFVGKSLDCNLRSFSALFLLNYCSVTIEYLFCILHTLNSNVPKYHQLLFYSHLMADNFTCYGENVRHSARFVLIPDHPSRQIPIWQIIWLNVNTTQHI